MLKEGGLLRNLSIYTMSNVINNGISFLLLPLYTRFLSPSDYGILALFITSVSLLSPFILLAANGAIEVEYFKLNKKELSNYISSALINNISSFIILLLLSILFSSYIEQLIKIPATWIWVIPLMAFLNVIPYITLGIFQMEGKPMSYASVNLGQALVNFTLGIALVVWWGMKWEGRIIGILLASSLTSIACLFLLNKLKLIFGKYSSQYSKDAFLFGLPLIPHAIGALVIEASDRYFISYMIGTTALGIYNIGYQIAIIIGVLESSFMLAFIPFLYKNLEANTLTNKIKIVKLSYLFLFCILGCVIVLTICTPFIFEYFIGKEYSEGKIFVFWIALSYFFSAVYKIFSGYIFYNKKTIILTYLSIINVLLNLLLNYLLIPKYGAIGAAYATLISQIIVAVNIIVISTTRYKMPWLFFIKK